MKLIVPPFVKGRATCIFCGSTENITKEHVFAKWLAKYFPRGPATTHTEVHMYWSKSVISRQPIDNRRRRQGHSGSRKIRQVCATCNNGWMSRLETWAMRALPLMIMGQRCNLVPSGQKGLATWAVKTAMLAERFQPHEFDIPQMDRTYLKENLKPPANWFVWIAAYKGKDWPLLAVGQVRAGLSPTPVRSPDLTPYYIQATTFGMGHLLVTVVGSSFPKIRDIFYGEEPNGAIQIWPQHPRSILWPPKRVLNDADANRMANIIKQPGVFDPSFDPGANWTFTI